MDLNELYKIALHEAGHAVIAVLMGKKFQKVTIRHRNDALGYLLYWNNINQLNYQLRGYKYAQWWRPETVARRVRIEVMITSGGFVAEGLAGINNPDGLSSDFKCIVDTALGYAGDESTKLIEECAMCVRQLIEDNWHHVKSIQDLLLKEKTITGKRVVAAMKSTGYKPFEFKNWEEYKSECQLIRQRQRASKAELMLAMQES